MLVALFLVALNVQGSGIYKWTDADGSICYGGQPPVDQQCMEMSTAPGVSDEDYQQAVQRARLNQQRLMECEMQREQERAEQRTAYEREQKEREQRCANSKQELTWLAQTRGPVVFKPNPDGTIREILAAERRSQMDSLNKQIEKECKDYSNWKEEWHTYFPPLVPDRQVISQTSVERGRPSVPVSRRER